MSDGSTGSSPSDDGDEPGDDGDEPGDERAGETRRMRRAIEEIRREGWKVAVIYATVDAALATLLSNLVLSVVRPSFLPARIPIPGTIADALRGGLGLTLADPAVAGGAVAGAAIGVVVFAVEVSWRVRRPLVEQFEAANPGLRESLRTARDAVEDDRRSRIAVRLYEDVLAELRGASSIGLLDLRRLTATVFVIALVSLATIQLAVADLSILGLDGDGDGPPPPDSDSSEYGGLQDASSIMGDPEDVPSGEENMDAVIDTSGSGSGEDGDGDSAASYDNSGYGGPESYESQRAGFSEGEQLEDAELIREYNLRIREGDDG